MAAQGIQKETILRQGELSINTNCGLDLSIIKKWEKNSEIKNAFKVVSQIFVEIHNCIDNSIMANANAGEIALITVLSEKSCISVDLTLVTVLCELRLINDRLGMQFFSEQKVSILKGLQKLNKTRMSKEDLHEEGDLDRSYVAAFINDKTPKYSQDVDTCINMILAKKKSVQYDGWVEV